MHFHPNCHRLSSSIATNRQDVELDPFDQYVETLQELDEPGRQRLTEWARNIVIFGDLMNGIAWNGLLLAIANMWRSAPDAVNVLHLLGGVEEGDQLQTAMALAHSRARAAGQDLYIEAMDDELVFDAFQAVEGALEERWEPLWDAAQAYARTNGWPGSTGTR